MASRFAIDAIYRLVDQFSGNSTKIKSSSKKLTRTLQRDFAKAQRQVNQLGANIKRNLVQGMKTAAFVGAAAIGAGLAIATKEFVNFDQAIVGAGARFSASADEMIQLKKAARDVGAATQFTAVQAAQGLNFYAKAGFTAAEAMGVLGDTVDLATVAQMDFERVADISSDLLGSLGKNSTDSATKISNLKEINRALGITANAANVDLEDMFETLKTAAPIATAAGEGMNELFAITGALGSAGIKGSLAATALKNAYIRLAAPTKEVNTALTEVGLKQKDFVDKSGKMKSMVDIMGMLGDKTKGLAQVDQVRIFSEIFGLRAVAGATNLSKSLSEVDIIMQKLKGEQTLKDIADRIRTGLGMQIEILKSSLLELGFRFVEAFEDDGRSALESITKAVQKFDVKPLIKNVKSLVGFLQGLWNVLSFLAPVIIGVVSAMAIYKVAMMAAALVSQLFGISVKAALGPIGWIAIGIGALIAVIVALVTNWDKVLWVLGEVGNSILWLGKTIADFFVWAVTSAIDWISKFGQKFSFVLVIFGPFTAALGVISSILMEIGKSWDYITKAFTSGDILGGILRIGGAILSGILAPIQGFLELVSKIPLVGDLAKGGAAKIAELRANLTGGSAGSSPVQSPVSPAERSATITNNNNTTGEIIINDNTGAANIARNLRRPYKMRMKRSEAF